MRTCAENINQSIFAVAYKINSGALFMLSSV